MQGSLQQDGRHEHANYATWAWECQTQGRKSASPTEGGPRYVSQTKTLKKLWCFKLENRAGRYKLYIINTNNINNGKFQRLYWYPQRLNFNVIIQNKSVQLFLTSSSFLLNCYFQLNYKIIDWSYPFLTSENIILISTDRKSELSLIWKWFVFVFKT